MAEGKGKVVKQAAFLMTAQMISSVIGLLYRGPLHATMGDLGDGYYQFAYEWYTIILLLASYSIPSAVSKVMSERLAVRQYRNAQKVFKGAVIYVSIAGGIGALVALIGGPLFLSSQPDAILALQVLAPTILLSGFLGVLRGFFQAHNTMKQTAISQVAEQLLNAIFSVLMAFLLTRPYVGDERLTAKFGAAGGTIGTGAGVLTGLLLMLFAYYLNRDLINRRIRSDQHDHEESYKKVVKVIFMMCTPIILATCVYNVTVIVDQVLYTHFMNMHGYNPDNISKLYGLFGFRARPIINIPIALASATSTALSPAVAASVAEKSTDGVISKVDECIKLTSFIAIPATVGIAILSYPIMFALFPGGGADGAAELLSWSAISVIFYSLSTVMNGALQGSGHPSIPVRNTVIALVINLIVMLIMVGPLNLHIYSIVAAMVVYSLAVFVLNTIAIYRRVGYLPEPGQFAAPVKSALVMGVVVAGIYWLPSLLLPSFFGRYLPSAILLVISVVAGILVYFAVYGRVSDLSDEEIRKMPMGTRLLGVMRRLHIR